MLKQKAFQTVDSVELLSIEHCAGGIDRLALDLRAPASERIKVLERDAPGVDL